MPQRTTKRGLAFLAASCLAGSLAQLLTWVQEDRGPRGILIMIAVLVSAAVFWLLATDGEERD